MTPDRDSHGRVYNQLEKLRMLLDSLRMSGLESWQVREKGPSEEVPEREVEPRREPQPGGQSQSPREIQAPGDTSGIEPPPLPGVPIESPDAERSASAEARLREIREELGDCTRCRLHEGRNRLVFGAGSAVAPIVFVGEGPGAEEDRQGLPFVGRAGRLLDKMIEALGFERSQIYICNVVKCRPPRNRTPESDEMATCSPFMRKQLTAIGPKVIVAMGAPAARTLLETNQAIGRLRGRVHFWRGTPLVATYHPAYLLRNPAAKGASWEDLKLVLELLRGESG